VRLGTYLELHLPFPALRAVSQTGMERESQNNNNDRRKNLVYKELITCPCVREAPLEGGHEPPGKEGSKD